MSELALNKKGFSKRTYRLKDFLYDLMRLLSSCPCLIRAACKKTIEPAFREKIMLAVSSVLGCRFCSWLHTELILKGGVDKKEITKILASEIGSFPEHEAIALAFAMHYSETQGRPKRELWKKVLNYYGEDTARTILSYIRAIYWGNLTGNTVEAFLYRLKGKPAEGSKFLDELVIFFLTAPYFLIILPLIVRMIKPNFDIRGF
ncbi:MAG: carboxymuconolactone decarboxylase family protein [Candidatus Desulfofervidaceae bacterium]|nr:carboxymuconolactone decarboxylase family protein [Candidatus Desulfofervidaceae bacterium]